MSSFRIDLDNLIESTESAQGRPLEGHERGQLELWRKGRDIATLVSHPGWSTVLEMLQDYSKSALKQLLETEPGNNEQVVAAQAVAYAVNKLYINFCADVQAAVAESKAVPEVMARSLRGRTQGPLDSIY
jgi:hypothetical protein